MASSVWGLVGLAPMEVELRDVGVPEAVDDAGGWWRSRNLTLPAVAKQEM